MNRWEFAPFIGRKHHKVVSPKALCSSRSCLALAVCVRKVALEFLPAKYDILRSLVVLVAGRLGELMVEMTSFLSHPGWFPNVVWPDLHPTGDSLLRDWLRVWSIPQECSWIWVSHYEFFQQVPCSAAEKVPFWVLRKICFLFPFTLRERSESHEGALLGPAAGLRGITTSPLGAEFALLSSTLKKQTYNSQNLIPAPRPPVFYYFLKPVLIVSLSGLRF